MNDGAEFDDDAAFADAGDDDGGSDTESDEYIEADMDLENNLRLDNNDCESEEEDSGGGSSSSEDDGDLEIEMEIYHEENMSLDGKPRSECGWWWKDRANPSYEAGRRFLCELPTHNSLYKAWKLKFL